MLEELNSLDPEIRTQFILQFWGPTLADFEAIKDFLKAMHVPFTETDYQYLVEVDLYNRVDLNFFQAGRLVNMALQLRKTLDQMYENATKIRQ